MSTITITDRNDLQVGDVVTVRVTDVGPGTDNGHMDYEFVTGTREVPEPTLPTTVGSVVLVRGMGGNRIALQLRAAAYGGKPQWLHAAGNPWVEPIVRDHLIEVIFDASEVAR